MSVVRRENATCSSHGETRRAGPRRTHFKSSSTPSAQRAARGIGRWGKFAVAGLRPRFARPSSPSRVECGSDWTTSQVAALHIHPSTQAARPAVSGRESSPGGIRPGSRDGSRPVRPFPSGLPGTPRGAWTSRSSAASPTSTTACSTATTSCAPGRSPDRPGTAPSTPASSSTVHPGVARLVGAAATREHLIAAAVVAAGRRRDGLAPVGRPPLGSPATRHRPGRRDPPEPVAGGRAARCARAPAARSQGPEPGATIGDPHVERAAHALRPRRGRRAVGGRGGRSCRHRRAGVARRAADRRRRPRPPRTSRCPGLPRRARRLGARRQAGRQRAGAGDAAAARAPRVAAGALPRRPRWATRSTSGSSTRRSSSSATGGTATVATASSSSATGCATPMLAAAGYVTVRFTYRQVTQRSRQVADRIRAVIRRWAPQLLDVSA